MKNTNIKRAPKANYKIFNTRTNRYESGNRSKSTWNSTHWIDVKLDEIKRYRGEGELSYLEIHIFPIETAIIKPAKVFIEELKEAAEEAKLSKLDIENRKKKALLNKKITDLTNELNELSNEFKLLG